VIVVLEPTGNAVGPVGIIVRVVDLDSATVGGSGTGGVAGLGNAGCTCGVMVPPKAAG
jgi:hypothetical protein